MIKPLLSALCGLLLLSACVKHTEEGQICTPIEPFSGRLLVMSTTKRFQVDIDWKGVEQKGELRLTHVSSGRIVDVLWEHESMFWHDNENADWSPLTEVELNDMGVILPPWILAKIFLGEMPNTMSTKNQLTWKGSWVHKKTNVELTVRWASDRKRVELVDIKHGRKVVVIINE